MENVEKEVRVIKRYANRKLYDCASSRYINLENLIEIMGEAEPFTVIDNKNNEDITSSIVFSAVVSNPEIKQLISDFVSKSRKNPLDDLISLLQNATNITNGGNND